MNYNFIQIKYILKKIENNLENIQIDFLQKEIIKNQIFSHLIR